MICLLMQTSSQIWPDSASQIWRDITTRLARLAILGYVAAMDQILEAIEEGLRRKGLSEAAASRMAAGNASVIKNLRRPKGTMRAHPIENLLRVAEVLDLEVYVGPPRTKPKVQIEAEPGGISVSDNWVVPQPVELPGLKIEPSYLAVRKDWLNENGLSLEHIRQFRYDIDGDLYGIGRTDVVLMDTSRVVPDGGAFAFLSSRAGFGVGNILREGDETMIIHRKGRMWKQASGVQIYGAIVGNFYGIPRGRRGSA